MPTYDYQCAGCGAFDAVRSIAERDRDAACPRCGEPAARVLGGAPRLAGLEAGTRRMMAAQQRASGEGSYPRMRHAGGCDCC